MNFNYIVRREKNEYGSGSCDCHYLVSTDTGRSYGYVRTPMHDELFHFAFPVPYGTREYLEIEEAKAYLEFKALEEVMRENKELERAFTPEEKLRESA